MEIIKADCGCDVQADELITHDGETYCEDCYHENYSSCSKCGEVIHNDVTYYSEQLDDSFCRSCYDNLHTDCCICNTSILTENSSIYNDDVYCEACYNENIGYCEDCQDACENNELNEDGLCESCADQQSGKTIKKHDYKPEPVFYNKDKNDKLYMGIELETECPCDEIDSIAEKVQGLSDKFYIKEDGSLSNGFEIVTHPASLQYHKEFFGWDKITAILKTEGCKSYNTDSCGIHIHVNKNFFSDTEKVKLGIFVNIQKTRIEKIAQRSNEQWSKFKEVKIKGITENTASRYEALNWQNNKTIEFRMFKGTIKTTTIYNYMEFVSAVSNFIKSISAPQLVKINEGWRLFELYLNDNKKIYASLIKYLINKNLMEVKTDVHSDNKTK